MNDDDLATLKRLRRSVEEEHTPLFLNDEDWRRIQENACRFHLGVTRTAFIAGWQAGTYDWDEPHPGVSSVAILFADEELDRP
jgi:hypothetical protein